MRHRNIVSKNASCSVSSMIFHCPKCSLTVSTLRPITLPCPACGTIIKCMGGDQPTVIKNGAKAWESLHGMQSPTMAAIRRWLATEVPSYGCGCKAFATEYIADNPPPLDDTFFEWTWRFHDAVDQKTGDERMTLEQARAYWFCNVCSKPATRMCSYTLPLGMCGTRLCDTCDHEHVF